eukprot:COSAG02_NODE_20739_length_817_cov_1.115599_1_plen_130_part_10
MRWRFGRWRLPACSLSSSSSSSSSSLCPSSSSAVHSAAQWLQTLQQNVRQPAAARPLSSATVDRSSKNKGARLCTPGALESVPLLLSLSSPSSESEELLGLRRLLGCFGAAPVELARLLGSFHGSFRADC